MTGPRKLPANPCPICGRSSAPEFHPFCSRRCADVDLARWLSDAYAIPVPEDEERPADEPDGAEPRGRG